MPQMLLLATWKTVATWGGNMTVGTGPATMFFPLPVLQTLCWSRIMVGVFDRTIQTPSLSWHKSLVLGQSAHKRTIKHICTILEGVRLTSASGAQGQHRSGGQEVEQGRGKQRTGTSIPAQAALILAEQLQVAPPGPRQATWGNIFPFPRVAWQHLWALGWNRCVSPPISSRGLDCTIIDFLHVKKKIWHNTWRRGISM